MILNQAINTYTYLSSDTGNGVNLAMLMMPFAPNLPKMVKS